MRTDEAESARDENGFSGVGGTNVAEFARGQVGHSFFRWNQFIFIEGFSDGIAVTTIFITGEFLVG